MERRKKIHYFLLVALIVLSVILYFYNTMLMALGLGLAFVVAFFKKQLLDLLKALGI